MVLSFHFNPNLNEMTVTPQPYGENFKKPPSHQEIICPSGRKIIRFDNLYDLLWYDDRENNPSSFYSTYTEGNSYKENRFKFTQAKKEIYRQAQRSLSLDKDFQKLVHKSKSEKRQTQRTKYGGNFLPVEYAKGEEKIFSRLSPGKKSSVLNMAFQVGTFSGGNYTHGFVSILKTILSAQALGIRLNIDLFDSDTQAVPTSGCLNQGYIICNVAKSTEKLDIMKILVASHPEFFNSSLFSGYSAQGISRGQQYGIGTFLKTDTIVEDLSPYYEIIGGNLVQTLSSDMSEEKKIMVEQVIKIQWRL